MSTSSDLQQACFGVTQGKIEEPTDQNGLSVFPLDGTSSNGQTLTYCFSEPSSGTPLQQRKVKHVLNQWENRANITFNCTDSQDATIHITFEPETLLITGYHAIPVQPPPPHPTINSEQDK
ncbi:hypothetical protein BJV77DRAFT_1065998 [Russula vinacea]|nr:hypothetical protein BJV77DRAFT_1065998 [Russula vinacea]